jgi:hypothetical protein
MVLLSIGIEVLERVSKKNNGEAFGGGTGQGNELGDAAFERWVSLYCIIN